MTRTPPVMTQSLPIEDEQNQGVAADAAALAGSRPEPASPSRPSRAPAANAGLREVYRSPNYSPAQVTRSYAKENRSFEEGGYRVVETNAERLTVREYVTQSDAEFTPDQIATMRERAEAGSFPSWTLVSDCTALSSARGGQ